MNTGKIIAVLGASGRSGKVFVEAAVRAGYNVRAGVYKGVLEPNPRIAVVACDATNSSDVANLISGADYVVSLIGHIPKSPKYMQTDAIKCVISEMERFGIRRLVSLTGTGVRIAGDRPSLLDRLANAAIRIVDPFRIKDGIAHVRAIESSTLDWTVVRVLKLHNGDYHNYSITPHGPAKLLTSRQEVAQCILSLLTDTSSFRTYPVIS